MSAAYMTDPATGTIATAAPSTVRDRMQACTEAMRTLHSLRLEHQQLMQDARCQLLPMEDTSCPVLKDHRFTANQLIPPTDEVVLPSHCATPDGCNNRASQSIWRAKPMHTDAVDVPVPPPDNVPASKIVPSQSTTTLWPAQSANTSMLRAPSPSISNFGGSVMSQSWLPPLPPLASHRSSLSVDSGCGISVMSFATSNSAQTALTERKSSVETRNSLASNHNLEDAMALTESDQSKAANLHIKQCADPYRDNLMCHTLRSTTSTNTLKQNHNPEVDTLTSSTVTRRLKPDRQSSINGTFLFHATPVIVRDGSNENVNDMGPSECQTLRTTPAKTMDMTAHRPKSLAIPHHIGQLNGTNRKLADNSSADREHLSWDVVKRLLDAKFDRCRWTNRKVAGMECAANPENDRKERVTAARVISPKTKRAVISAADKDGTLKSAAVSRSSSTHSSGSTNSTRRQKQWKESEEL